MSTKGRRGREQAGVTFPAPEEEPPGEDEDRDAEAQRRRRGWRGVNGGLEPRSAPALPEAPGPGPPPCSPEPGL
ncbi:hypothetical protein J0S82_013794 [Galemys pyrenaicus]|uniref:Uncharacterized protein n=1 Tax=Galemys pyrenaicus TaxID=202257 RepID=A0A8J6A237_GALPY|nr:hypothetical protein J0S82_013794 [Galemys pyrenaicus]